MPPNNDVLRVISKICASLSIDSRIKILLVIKEHSGTIKRSDMKSEYFPNDYGQKLDFHLANLKKSGLIVSAGKGRYQLTHLGYKAIEIIKMFDDIPNITGRENQGCLLSVICNDYQENNRLCNSKSDSLNRNQSCESLKKINYLLVE